MPESIGFILGFDPGGAGNFGWSECGVASDHLQRPLKTGLADDAWDALNQVKDAIRSSSSRADPRILAAGIDAPLFWGRRGNRAIDAILRQALKRSKFPTPGGTVQQVNSLRGACMVQGVLLAKYLREWDPQLPITEAHPKALQHLLRHSGQPEMTELARLTEGLEDREHERDATLSAIGAWAMYKKLPGWRDIYDQECRPVQLFDTPVAYWMPLPQEEHARA